MAYSERVVKILMKRDGISRSEAEEIDASIMRQVKEGVENGDIFIMDDLLMDEAGLEPDYFEDYLYSMI